MRSYRYLVTDVFTQKALEGNMLAVFPDAAGLGDGEMQDIARELNLSETSFVFAAEAGGAARVRFFTPTSEIPFAGHPTIGTTFVLAHLGRANGERLVLEERVGPVEVRIERRADPFVAWLRTPPIAFGRTFDRDACARVLGLEPGDLYKATPAQVVSAGNPFLYVALRDAASVDRAVLDTAALARLASVEEVTGVFFFAPVAEDAFYSRMMAPLSGVHEDPATGSATGPLGAYLAEYGLVPRRDGTRFTSEQGVKMKRRSLLHGILRYDAAGTLETVEVGGSAVLTADATMFV